MSSVTFFPENGRSGIVIPIVTAFLIVSFTYLLLWPAGTAVLGPAMGLLWVVAETIILALVASAPFLYGWFTKRPRESAFFGVLITVFLYSIGFLAALQLPGGEAILRSVAYGGVSALFGGGAGYMAARGELRYSIVAVLFVLLWVITLLSGLN